MKNKNPNSYYTHREYYSQDVRFPDLWEEIRFQVAIGPQNGKIIGFDPENERIAV